MHEFLKIKHGYVQNTQDILYVRQKDCLELCSQSPKGLPKGFHTHYPIPREVLGLKSLKSTITPTQLPVYYPIITHPIYSHFE